MAGQSELIVIVEDLREFSVHLTGVIRQLYGPGGMQVQVCSHRSAYVMSDQEWGAAQSQGLRAVLVDAHDLSREREWARGARDRPFPLAGADVGRRLLGLADPPRLVMYSGEMDNPMINVGLRQATGSRATGYYAAEDLQDEAVLKSALHDPVPIGQFPPPSREDLATYAGAWDAANLAHARAGSGVFDLLVGGEEAIKAVRKLPGTARDTTQKALRRLAKTCGFDAVSYRPWDEMARRMQEAVGLRRRDRT